MPSYIGLPCKISWADSWSHSPSLLPSIPLSNCANRGPLLELASIYSLSFFNWSHAAASGIWMALTFLLNRVWQVPEQHFTYVAQFAFDLNKWRNRTSLFALTENFSTVCFNECKARTLTDIAASASNIFSPMNNSLVLVWQLNPYWWLLISGLEVSVKCWN